MRRPFVPDHVERGQHRGARRVRDRRACRSAPGSPSPRSRVPDVQCPQASQADCKLTSSRCKNATAQNSEEPRRLVAGSAQVCRRSCRASTSNGLSLLTLPRRLRAFAALATAALVTGGVAAGFAFARTRSAPIGTGVVVIETNLGYQGGQAAGRMVLTSSGEILTNNHVIRGATTITIRIPRTGRSYTAKVIGYNVTADVAVVQASGASNWKTVALGTSSGLKIGQLVKAVGNAGRQWVACQSDRTDHGALPHDHGERRLRRDGNAPGPGRDERRPAARRLRWAALEHRREGHWHGLSGIGLRPLIATSRPPTATRSRSTAPSRSSS